MTEVDGIEGDLVSCGVDEVCATLALADLAGLDLLSVCLLFATSAVRVPFLGPVHVVVPCFAFHPQ